MSTLTLVVIYSLLGGVISLIGGILLLSREKLAKKLAKYVTPFAAGALLAAVFLDLLPEGVEAESSSTVFMSALIGMVAFFFAERFLIWFHHHHPHEDEKNRGASLIVVGDTVHNALDGVAIAAAFLISVPTGIVTTIAVAAHEIPQEIGDFGLLLHKGLKKGKILLINIISALATLVTAVIVYSIGDTEALPVGVLLGLSAGFLLYIAASDIIPEIHEQSIKKNILDWSAIMLVVGVVTVGGVIKLAHDNIGDEHGHGHGIEEVHEHEEEGAEHGHEEGHSDGGQEEEHSH